MIDTATIDTKKVKVLMFKIRFILYYLLSEFLFGLRKGARVLRNSLPIAENYDPPRAFLISSQVGMTSLPGSVTISVEIMKSYWGTFLVTPRNIGRTA